MVRTASSRDEYPIPPENPAKVQGPEVGTLVLINSTYAWLDGHVGRVTARSYVWGPGDPAYHGGARRYDWKVVEWKPGKSLVLDDKDLEPIKVGDLFTRFALAANVAVEVN